LLGLSLTDVLQQRLDLIVLGLSAGAQVTGLYSVANSLIRVLTKLVQSYWRALLPTFARLASQATAALTRLDDQATRWIAAGTCGAAALTTVVATPMVSLIFGTEYAPAGPMLAVLVWTAPLYAVELRAITRLIAQQRSRSGLTVAVVHLLTLLLLLVLMVPVFEAMGAAVATLGAGAVAALVGSWKTRNETAGALWAHLLLIWGSSLAVTGLGWMLTAQLGMQPWLALVVCGLAYTGLLFLTRSVTVSDLERVRAAVTGSGA
jgi:O-antigen/teichoic acid export membrane protein